jgi:signal transduction histidine kinase
VPMAGRARSVVTRYGTAAAAYVLILILSRLARRWLGFNLDATPIIILTMIAAAWYGGLGPGLLVGALFEATLDYYSVVPRNSARFTFIAFNRMLLFGSVVVFASARRAAERSLRGQQAALEATLARERAARADAEAANRLKDEFLATVSHELRTPLNATLGWAAMLNRSAADERTIKQAAGAIERTARAQAQIVEDILDASRMVTGRLRIDPQVLLLAPVVEEAVETMRVAAAAKNIALEIALEPDAVVLGDGDRLRQIAWNLISNAIKFTPEGGRIEVAVRRGGRGVDLVVRDTGAGIPKAFVPHLFERFRQADASMTRDHGGLGLGLAIVRHLAELHGGTVTGESAGEGLGAVFTVHLPAAQAAAAVLIPGA